MNDRSVMPEKFNFENPLGYYCYPNGATPDYVASHDIHTFIAFGLWMCHVKQEDTYCRISDSAIIDSREQFLNVLENAIECYEDIEHDGEPAQGDVIEPNVFLTMLDEPEDCEDSDGCNVDWLLDFIEPGGDVCISRFWTSCDPDSIWLSHECVDTPEKRQSCFAVIEETRKILRKAGATLTPK